MRIAICFPAHRETEALFTLSLAAMALQSAKALPHDFTVINARSALVDARNNIVEMAKERRADWLLWLDADTTFPPDTLIRLLGHGLDVVGCNYARRQAGALPTASKNGRPLLTTAADARAGKIEEVDSLGLGVCLTRATVFDAIERPWFTIKPNAERTAHLGEDETFFAALRGAGISAHVDHQLSWQVGHIDEHILTNEGTGRGYVSSAVRARSGAG